MIDPPDAIPTGTAAEGKRTPRRLFSLLRIGAIWGVGALAAGLAAFALVSAVVPLTCGPLGFVQVFEEQLLLGALVVCAPLALLTRLRPLVLSVIVAALVFGGLFASEWISLPGASAGRSDLAVLTWNLEYGSRTPEEAVAELQQVTTDVVALQELEPGVASAIERDPALTSRFPYRLMEPGPLAWGIGLLSRYPLSDTYSIYPPACVEALVSTASGPVRVIVGHPRHADVHGWHRLLPLAYDPTDRDRGIATIRERVEASLGRMERLVLVGDFNTTPTESEYAVLSRYLRDTHVDVGEGPGWTWRPGRFAFLPFGFLRIDLQLSGGAIRPSSTWLRCSGPGDHCQVYATYRIDPIV